MNAIVCMLFLLFVSPRSINANVIRGNSKSRHDKTLEDGKPRQLSWIWAPDFTVVKTDSFYDHRSEQWWNDARITGGATDPDDFLRDTDICFSPYDGTYSRENCPTPPNCSWSGEEGPAKLCINRVPFPDDHSTYYVLMMKCTPQYINCDKCMCGNISSDNDINSFCNYADQDPSDDQVNIRCDDPSHIEMITVDGRKFTFSPYFYY